MQEISQEQIKDLRDNCEEVYKEYKGEPFHGETRARIEGMAWAFAWILEEKDLPDEIT